MVAGCAHKQATNYNYKGEPDPRKHPFVLGPSDVLRVSVWKNPDLSGDATIRPDGTITLPLVGELRAADRTAVQVRDEIAQRLATYLKSDAATVTVAVIAVNSYRFTVSGNVEKGGALTSAHYVTVTEAIAMAGGANRFASPDETVIMRPNPDGTVKRIPIDYPAILTGARPDQNLVLLPGDVVYVP
jgi:polysaccharide export outer membrane protein